MRHEVSEYTVSIRRVNKPSRSKGFSHNHSKKQSDQTDHKACGRVKKGIHVISVSDQLVYLELKRGERCERSEKTGKQCEFQSLVNLCTVGEKKSSPGQ